MIQIESVFRHEIMCKGGGGGSTTTTSSTIQGDPVYNAGMLKLAQEQQEWSQEMYDIFKTGLEEGDTSEMRFQQNLINEQQSALEKVAPKYIDEVVKGADSAEKMRQAQADVAQGFGAAIETTNRVAARRGLDPRNLNFNKIATERARQTGLARTQARTLAENETFKRLSDAMRLT